MPLYTIFVALSKSPGIIPNITVSASIGEYI